MSLRDFMFFIGIPYTAVLVALWWVFWSARYRMTEEEQFCYAVLIVVWPVTAPALAIDQFFRWLRRRA